MLVIKNKASKQNQHKSIRGRTILDMAVTCTHETSTKWLPKQELHKDTSWKAEVNVRVSTPSLRAAINGCWEGKISLLYGGGPWQLSQSQMVSSKHMYTQQY